MNTTIKKIPPLFLIMLIAIFPQISETIYSPSLPDIASTLSTTPSFVQWTLGTYFVGFAIGVYCWGGWSDKVGRRKALIFGILVYLFSTALCMVSRDINMLLMARVLQGFGASVGSVVNLTISREVFSGRQRDKVFSAVGMSIAIAPAIGPFIGGFIVELFHWRANFLFLIALVFVILILIFLYLPETLNAKQIIKTRRSALWKKLLIDRKFIYGALLIGLALGINFSFYAEAPFIYIKLFHVAPSHFGSIGLVIAAAVFFSNIVSFRLNHYFHYITIVRLAALTSVAGSVLLVLLSIYFHHFETATGFLVCFSLSFLIVFFGICLILTNALANSLSHYNQLLGVKSSVFGVIYYALLCVLMYIVGVIHNGDILRLPEFCLALSIIILIISIDLKRFDY